ncbi:P-loop containing nucleoside triphosphate hydrolase protein [Mycena metata]|uniref:P-loop containing nucleoside triphosphate hydrolase protein n=1 Tax=Mycena metata TaxID=1033252 RepID=A0AAD7GY60_9AGAR|nr:P-loop containing nucleoside triphosphate hydrolase protein [Mycena metata]
MPRQQTVTEVRLDNISKCVTITVNTLDVLVNTLKIPGLEAMVNTTQSLLKLVQTIKQDKNECAELMEQTHNILNAIIGVYVKSDTGIELPPSTLHEIADFTQTLHKIHTFIEAQQSGSKVKKFFRQGELSGLLKDCKTGLQEGIKFFQIKSSDIMSTAREMEEQAQIRHQEVLNAIETISSSDSASSISRMYSGSYASSNSISLLPAEPKIFHGRESELADILKHFEQSTPRIAILGAGGMGKTSLAQAVLHHEKIVIKYQGNRLFVACDTAASKVELAGLIGAHLGMKPGKDLTRAVLDRLSEGSPTLLILDNLETVWEPAESRKEVEEFLSLLTDITSLALMITMRGAERPSKVQWTRPFLPSLEPLSQEAARKVFIAIAEDRHPMEEINQVLHLTDNMPLSINLLAHAVDVEGTTAILSRWQREHTSVISEGYDRRSNLESSILLSLESPRITSTPHSQELLSLLSILPDGLSDVELRQSKFAIQDVLDCKRALLCTALAYLNDHKRLKALVPIREYMAKFRPPTNEMIGPLLKHFQELLQAYGVDRGKQSSALYVERLTSNSTNIPNIIQNGLYPGHPNLADSISCTSHFIQFNADIGRETIPLIDKVITLLPYSEDHQAKASFIVKLFGNNRIHSIPHPEALMAQTLELLKTLNDPDLEAPFTLI